MIDPVTALATASAAFNVIKKGFEVGRDIESMAGDIGRWMGAVSDIKKAEELAKNPPLFKKLIFKKSVEEEAMEVFMAKKKLKTCVTNYARLFHLAEVLLHGMS